MLDTSADFFVSMFYDAVYQKEETPTNIVMLYSQTLYNFKDGNKIKISLKV